MAFEALSRGATRAVLVERDFPRSESSRRVPCSWESTIGSMVLAGDAFAWNRRRPDLGANRNDIRLSTVRFFVQRAMPCRPLIEDLFLSSPLNSLLVVESDDRFEEGICRYLASGTCDAIRPQ